jgi:DNA-binding transcriptional regulator LsrR (DeoR family)
MSAEERKQLENLTSSRSESTGKVGMAKSLLAYAEGIKTSAICRKFGLTRRIVEYTIDKALNPGIRCDRQIAQHNR